MSDRTVTYRLRAELGAFRAQMAQAGASVKGAADRMTSATREGQRFRAGLDTLGASAGRAGLAAAAGLGAALVSAANFDQAMSNVQAATHETEGNMRSLREAALQAGADTAFSATEAAAGVEELAKAGVSTADILGGGLTGALDLAAAGGLEVADAAEISATALTQFKLAGEDVSHVADLLAAGAGKAQGSVSDMGMALKQSGLVAAQTGLTVEETTGTLAAFASAGLIGSDAGTSFKTMLQSLTPTSAKAKNLMDDLGISAYDASGNFVGMTAFAASLEQGLAGLSVEQQNAAMKTIFGADAVRAASVVFSQGADGIQQWIDNVDDAGYAAETAATRMDNLKGDLEQLGGALQTAFIGTGDGSQGMLRSLTQGLTEAVNAFNELPPAAHATTSAFLGITAVTGGGLWFGSKVIGGIADTREALSQLGVQANITKRQLALRGAAGGLSALAFGLGSLNEEAGATGQALSTLSDTAGFAALGFTVGGPWGAAIGGAIGLLKNLGNAQHAAAVEAEDLADAIDGQTLALNEQGYAHIGEQLADYADVASAAGLSLGEFIKAAVAGGDELARVDAILESFVDTTNSAITSESIDPSQVGAQTELVTKAEDFRDVLSDQNGEVREAINLAKGRQAGLEAATSATKSMTGATGRSTARIREQSQALKESRNAARQGAEQFVGLGKSLDDAKVSLGGWMRQLEKQAAALRDFRVNAQRAAKRGLDEGLIASLNEAGPAGALRMKQLANATDLEIRRANRAWRSMQREVNLTTDAIGGVPRDIKIKATAETGSAMAKLYELNRLKLDDKVLTVHTVRVGGGLDFVSGGQQKAAGGPIRAAGGSTLTTIPTTTQMESYS